MKLAKASQQEIDTLMRWLQSREKSDDAPPSYMRVVFGYETLVQNCCDPKADTLEFSPELQAAKEDKARLDWMQEHAREDGRTMAMPRYAYRVKHWEPTAGPNIREAIDAAKREVEAPR